MREIKKSAYARVEYKKYMCILDVMCPQESQVFVVYRPIFLPKISKISSAKRSFRSIRVANSHLPMSRAFPVFYGPGARFFSRLRCRSPFFPRPARSLVNLVSAICTVYINFVSLCSKLRVISFQTHPLSPLYICFVRSLFDRQHGGDRFSTLYQLRLDSTELDSFDYRFRDRVWRSS